MLCSARRRIGRLALVVSISLLGYLSAAPAAAQDSARTAAPTLALELPAEDVEKLRRELARRGTLGVQAATASAKTPKARGFATAEDERVAVRIELLEQWSERLEGDRWPLRIVIPGDDYLFGIERFALRAPAIGGYQAEMLMVEQLRREGVLAPRAFFVRVSLNGEDLGLMKLQEELTKEMIEAQQRRRGAVLRFEDGRTTDATTPGLAHTPDDFLARPLVLERSKQGKKTAQLAAERILAVELLDAFLAGALRAHDVFDVELTARFLAVCELWRSVDTVRWPNLRFYFNPVTKRLEPIAHAASPPALFLEEGLVATSEAWPKTLLRDAELRSAFEKHLRRIAGEAASGKTEEWLRDEELPLLRALRSEQREHAPIALAPIALRAQRLAQVELGSPAETPAAQDAQGTTRLVGRHPVRNPVPSASRDEALAAHPFLSWNEADQRFELPVGVYSVEGSLVLPRGAGLRVAGGTTLRFAETAMLVASGPLEFLGTAEARVVLEGRPAQDGKRGKWQGLVIFESDEPHLFENVDIRNTSGIDQPGWSLTGGITIRASVLRMRNTRIVGSVAEDALNLIRTRFSLENLEIIDARSDALDADFSSGTIEACRFAGIGGDAIDVSGAEVSVSETEITNVGDKAISVGEFSRLVANGLTIRSVGTALASKDGSVALIEDSSVSRVRHVVLMAYTKKAEYGGAELEARGLEIHEVRRAAVAQRGSRIVIDGAVQLAENFDVDTLYRGYMRK